MSKENLEAFVEVMRPKGLFLWVATDNEEDEIAIIKRIGKWEMTAVDNRVLWLRGGANGLNLSLWIGYD